MKKELPRILIAGTNSGCGKTTFVSGLLTALKRREKDLRAFKCGPDYIDPMFHASALGVPCRNLDLQFFDENTLRFSLAKNGGSLSVIEGVTGTSTHFMLKTYKAKGVLEQLGDDSRLAVTP